MVTDQQVKLLFKLVNGKKRARSTAAAKAGMSENTARKYLRAGKLPSEMKTERTYRTRPDAFAEVWGEILPYLEENPGLEVKAVFEHLQRRHPGQFQSSQLRTLQRRVKRWRAEAGPGKEVFFDQAYEPGERAQSDFTCMNKLGVTIQGQPFKHMLFHFVLPYSNWEAGTICTSESFEALSEGLQNALTQLGGVPRLHQTDSMSCAVRNLKRTEKEGAPFTDRYGALMRHYGMEAQHTQPRRPNENGKIEQSHFRLKRAIGNQLALRGSSDFESRQEYEAFLAKVFAGRNANREARLKEDQAKLRSLPARRLNSYQRRRMRVSKGGLVRVKKNWYSVNSRLIGELVDVRIYAERIEVWYAQRRVTQMPRLHGTGKARVEYRHVIDMLVRKPGAFAHYRYKADLFPSHTFRMAYDELKRVHSSSLAADKQYLRVLHLAAKESEAAVSAALSQLLNSTQPLTLVSVKTLMNQEIEEPSVQVCAVDLSAYNSLLHHEAQ